MAKAIVTQHPIRMIFELLSLMLAIAPAEFSATVEADTVPSESASSTEITARDIASVPIRTAEDALRLVPGLTLVQHGGEGKGYQFFLRGFDALHGSDLEITVDDIPWNEWSNVHAQGYLDLGIVIPELVRRVHVIKGPFTTDQGAFAMAGSARYQLGVDPQDRGFRTQYLAGTTNRHRLLAGWSPRNGTGDDFVVLEATHDDGFGQNRNINRGTLNARHVVFDSIRFGSLSVMGLGGASHFGLPGAVRNDDLASGRMGFYDSYDDAGAGTSARGVVSVNYVLTRGQHRLSAVAYGGYRHLDLVENFTGFLEDPGNGDRRHQTHDAWSWGLRGRYEWNMMPSLKFHGAAGLHGEQFSQASVHVGKSLETIDVQRNLQGLQTLLFAHGGFHYQPVRRLRVNAGVRLDTILAHVNDHTVDEPSTGGARFVASPRITASLRMRDNVTGFVAYGRGYRPPEARSLTSYTPARTGIVEEIVAKTQGSVTVADSMETGFRYTPSLWLGTSLAGFATFIARESIYDHVSGLSLELNGTRRLGAEWVVWSDPFPWMRISADVTYTHARFTGSGNPVPFAPWLVGGASVVVQHPSGFQAGLRFLGLAPRTLPHDAKSASLMMLDASIGYRYRGWFVQVQIENIANMQLREGEYHYPSGWPTQASRSELPAIHVVAGPPLNARFMVGWSGI